MYTRQNTNTWDTQNKLIKHTFTTVIVSNDNMQDQMKQPLNVTQTLANTINTHGQRVNLRISPWDVQWYANYCMDCINKNEAS